MKLAIFALALSFTAPAFADSCLDGPNINKAYVDQVEALLVSAHLEAVPRKHIIPTVTIDQDVNDPEYNVILNDGSLRHVTCDDSGDDQCDCEFGNGSN